MSDMTEAEQFAMIAADPQLVAKQITALKYARAQLDLIKDPLNEVAEMIGNWCNFDDADTKAALKKIQQIDSLSADISVFLLDRLDDA